MLNIIKSVFCVLLFCLVAQAQFPPYSLDEFVTVPPNATVCSSTNILADLVLQATNFSWTVDSNAYVNWTLESQFYPVLGSIECPKPQSLIWNSDGVWACNPDISLTGDILARLSCPNTVTNQVVFTGPDQVTCDNDHDTLAGLSCPVGSLVKETSSGWACGNDNNLLATIVCNATDNLLTFINDAWGCYHAIVHTDTFEILIATCTNGYIPKYINGVWQCAMDDDTLGFTCPTDPNSRLQRSADGLSWICGPPEADTFRSITEDCTGDRDTPFLSLSGWECIPTPLINNSLTLGTVLFEWSVTLQPSGSAVTSPSSQLQPYFLAYPGQLRGFQMKVSPTQPPTVLQSSLFLNGVNVNNITFSTSTTNVTGNLDLGIFFTANSNLSFTLTSIQGGGYVNLGVYAQINAS